MLITYQDLLSAVYYLLPAFIAAFIVLSAGNEFLVTLYGLRPPANGWRHILSLMFRFLQPRIYAEHGELTDDSKIQAAAIIGGPTLLEVADDSAALLEYGAGYSRIVGKGLHHLALHERVRNVIDLRTHYRKDFQKVLTKDGIPVKMEVDLTFRLTEKVLPDDPPPVSPPPLSPVNRLKRRLGLRVRHDLLETSRPHRFSRETVRRLTYETAVAAPGQPPDWAASFYNVRSGDITDQVANRRLDEISAPEGSQVHPRAEITRKGLEDARDAAARTAPGIEILDMNLGVIEPQDKFEQVTAQLIANWTIEWERRAKILEAEAEANRTKVLEEARAEAQANMIQALTEGYRIATGNNPNVSKDVVALRFIDTLEALLTRQPLGEDIDVETALRYMRRESDAPSDKLQGQERTAQEHHEPDESES